MPRLSTAAALLLFGGLLLLAGCNDEGGKDDYKTVDKNAKPAAGKGHDDHDHAHGDKHDPHGEGPHHGHIHDIGVHDYRAELVMDKDRNLTIYLLQHDNDDPLVVDTEAVVLTLKGADGKSAPVTLEPVKQDGDAEGKASAFRATADKLPENVKAEDDIDGELTVTVDGKPLKASLEHHDH